MGVPIMTANMQPNVLEMGCYRQFVEYTVISQRRWLKALDWRIRGSVRAEIVRSAWRVTCPYCGGALVAEPGEPFFCVDCLMQNNGGCALAVVFPERRAEIEAILMMRPNPLTRNWMPDETVEILRAENREHGVAVPGEG